MSKYWVTVQVDADSFEEAEKNFASGKVIDIEQPLSDEELASGKFTWDDLDPDQDDLFDMLNDSVK